MKRICLLVFLVLSTRGFTQTGSKPVVTDKLQGTNCDNVVHNLITWDASNRSASECEAQFDQKIRTALRNAFQKVFLNFPATDWTISDTAIKELKEVGKKTEQNFFDISYYFKIDLSQQSPMYKNWYDKFQPYLDELKNPKADSYQKFEDFGLTMNNAIHINFYILVNNVSNSIYFLKGGQQTLAIPGSVYAVRGPRVASLTGGGNTAGDACLILFGSQKPEVKTEPGGATGVNRSNGFPKNTSHLTVQNISIRIECNKELLNKIIEATDFKTIADLVGK